MKKYLNGMFSVSSTFAIAVIYTNFCYAQAPVARPAAQAPVARPAAQAPKKFPFEKKFFEEMPLSKLNSKSVPVCREIFTKSCGQADFPKMIKFTSCLQEKFETFKQNSDCSNFAHALIYTNYVGFIPRTVAHCRVFYEKCEFEAKKDRSIGVTGCVKRNPKLPPVCVKLVSESYNYRTSIAQIYDRRIAPDLDYKK